MSQKYLEKVQNWTLNQKMGLNVEKTKTMIFNFTKEKQFTVNMMLNGKNIEVVKETKLLGTILTNDLKWNRNTEELIKRANKRMVLLRKIKEFNPNIEDLKIIYIMYIRSILEQSCQVWHHSLYKENITDLERIQKSALRIILNEKQLNYDEALKEINLQDLHSRREFLCQKFAENCIQNGKTKSMFPVKKKI